MTSAKFIVAYPQPKDIDAFEAVYQDEHVPLAIAKLAGKTKIVATKVMPSPQAIRRSIALLRCTFLPWKPLSDTRRRLAVKRR